MQNHALDNVHFFVAREQRPALQRVDIDCSVPLEFRESRLVVPELQSSKDLKHLLSSAADTQKENILGLDRSWLDFSELRARSGLPPRRCILATYYLSIPTTPIDNCGALNVTLTGSTPGRPSFPPQPNSPRRELELMWLCAKLLDTDNHRQQPLTATGLEIWMRRMLEFILLPASTLHFVRTLALFPSFQFALQAAQRLSFKHSTLDG
ncbi:hypothetical protein BOTBODRAFT_40478 [Botryobasidium botryosum FD-172 SS1]|uniref:Uncharacterized protein n=1 Tax=Botryobasidium botryosum (strain FD-172 SS1) TaxID=930990 RepID=A0A067NDK9_BOTB1|nr:hypothetical protein BOTBODRAFT_40478 [Botryobasidium botryosum FD-172 SS1]